MIEQVDRRLESWVRSTVGEATLTFAPPGAERSGAGVCLYLLELADNPPLRGGSNRPPLQLSLRYLVTTWAQTHELAHRLLGTLVFAAMEEDGFEVELKPLPAASWEALGAVPQPSFVLKVLLRLDREEPAIPIVRAPAFVDGSPLTEIYGVVLGPGDVPLAGARIEYPIMDRFTNADARGRFHFQGIPAEPRTKHIRIKSKGKIFDVSVERPTSADDPVVFHCDVIG